MRQWVVKLSSRSQHWTLALLLLGVTACTNTPMQFHALEPLGAGESASAELTKTPFFPQQAYHCGPAALATLLVASGVEEITPDVLADQVYLPNQRGSLQAELVAATRRADRVPYVLEPKLQHLLSEIRAGNPVLILQNLALPRWPTWHYAVVIGFDLEKGDVILRSGENERQVLSLKRFERTWQWGDYWALVVPPPDQLPATATPARYVEAVAALEQQQRWQIATQGYLAAAKQWPDNPLSQLGLGNIAYHHAAYGDAAARFQAAIDIAPDSPAPHYNLAWAQLRQGNVKAARLAARTAEALSPDHPRFGKALAAIDEAAAKISTP